MLLFIVDTKLPRFGKDMVTGMVKIGVLGPSDIAKRRMVPALKKSGKIEYIGVAAALTEERGEAVLSGDIGEGKKTALLEEENERGKNALSGDMGEGKKTALLEEENERGEAAFSADAGDSGKREDIEKKWAESLKKAAVFKKSFGGKIFEGYENMLQSDEIDAVYIALPPALHYRWAKRALECGKHVLLEKPFTVQDAKTRELLKLAEEKKLAVFENYGFIYHRQIKAVQKAFQEGEIGELRLVRADFAFPYRGGADFRYSGKLGGGALLDCGGYTLKAAELFLKGEIQVLAKKFHYLPGHDVDMYGSVTLEDEKQQVAQLFFGMDNAYVCELELWGSKGIVSTKRAFTAPDTLDVPVTIRNAGGEKVVQIPADDQFLAAAEVFAEAVSEEKRAAQIRQEIARHSALMSKVMP